MTDRMATGKGSAQDAGRGALEAQRLAPRWFFRLIAPIALALVLAGCAVVTVPSDGAPLPDQGFVDEGDFAYTETPEDCLEGEQYDEEEQLCYTIVYCDENGNCEDGSDTFLDSLFGMVDQLLPGTAGDDFENAAELDEHTLVTYRVQGNEIVEPEYAAVTDDLKALQADAEKQKKIWVFFAQLIPAEQRADLTEYVVFTDGVDGVLAFVTQETDDPTKWLLAVDIADTNNPEDLTFTLVHEFAHLLTLNNRQVPANRELALEPDNQALYEAAVAACPAYFPGEGCSRPDSYINRFYERFWANIYAEWQAIGNLEDEEEQAAAAEAFYNSKKDQFVSEYAASGPEEDIAESFATFVLKPKPTGDTIADQKVAFFYDFPELVKLRAGMTARLYSRLRRR